MTGLGGVALWGTALALALTLQLPILMWVLSGEPPSLVRRAGERLAARWPRRRRSRATPLPPILLGMELRRLGGEIRRVEESNLPAKASRLAACATAYDHVLIEYCRSVDLPVPAERGPLTPSQRFEAESALICTGHDW